MKANRWLAALAVVVLVLGGAGCFRDMISEVELKVPEMENEAAATIVSNALLQVGKSVTGDNVLAVTPDVERRVVTVRYNNAELGLRNLQVAVRHAGFAVDDLPADEAARSKLPAAAKGRQGPAQDH